MKVSVVIPVFNEEKYIYKCLKSLMNQEERADEIIVVDNNSTDKSMDIVRRFPNIRIIRQTIQGIIAARNLGFDRAKHEIIARCDADSIPPKDWIKKIKQNFQKKDIVALGGPVATYDMPFFKNPFLCNMYSFFADKIYNCNVLVGANMAIRKDVWEKIKAQAALKDHHVHEDVDVSILLSKVGKIGFDEKLIVNTSARSIVKDPYKLFIKYPVRLYRTQRRFAKAD